MDASEIYSKKPQCKRSNISRGKKENLFFQTQMDASKPLEEIRTCEHPPWYGIDHFKEKVKDIFVESQKGLFLHHPKTHFRMPVKRWMIFGMSRNFIYRHHVEPRVKLYSPREEAFPIPLKHIDVSKTTRTNLDVMQERRIDDYWNIDGSRVLSGSWTGFTQFALLEEKPPDRFLWSGERLTKRQVTSRPDHLWPELWTELGGNAQLKEKQKWSNEKLHQRLRMGESLPNHHEDHVAGRGNNSLQHYNLVHKFIHMLQAMKDTRSKGSSGQGMGEIGKDSGVGLDESQK